MTTNPKPKPRITRRQFAELAGVTQRTVGRWDETGVGPKGRKLGGRFTYDPAEVRAFLAEAGVL